jgi:excisionase family DNA binding protein
MGKEEEQLVILLKKLEDLEKGNEQINNSLEELKAIILQDQKQKRLGQIEFFDVSEVAQLLNISKRSARKLFSQRQIEGMKDSTGRIKFNKSEVYKYIYSTLMPNQYGIKGSE